MITQNQLQLTQANTDAIKLLALQRICETCNWACQDMIYEMMEAQKERVFPGLRAKMQKAIDDDEAKDKANRERWAKEAEERKVAHAKWKANHPWIKRVLHLG